VESSGLISTLAGTGADGYSGDGGPANQAMLNFPWGLATSATGGIYIADRVNNRIRVVTNILTGLPTLTDASTVNGASFTATISPGAIVSIFGADFASNALVAATAPLPTVLGETSVTFNGVAAPLFYVSNGQINAQAPFDLQTGVMIPIQVKRGNSSSLVRTAKVAAVSPGIFIIDQASSAGAILHAADYSVVNNNSPARPGEYVLIYCTGLGPLTTPVKSGESGPSAAPFAETIYAPTVSVAGLTATVSYSGLAPGFAGLYQVNAQMPANLPAGNQSIQITILGATSNTATIAAAR
jgi:uncharacterized protein (TIGR03437 family)